MLVTWVAPPDEVFTAVAAEVHRLLDTDLTAFERRGRTMGNRRRDCGSD